MADAMEVAADAPMDAKTLNRFSRQNAAFGTRARRQLHAHNAHAPSLSLSLTALVLRRALPQLKYVHAASYLSHALTYAHIALCI